MLLGRQTREQRKKTGCPLREVEQTHKKTFRESTKFGTGAEKRCSLDKRSGFWQVELTKRAQDLSAFIAPNGQVFKWKVMPFGLTNAPATFQELMNQVVARMKLKRTVQALLKKGAVIEVYIDDALLGTNDADDHLCLVEEFLRTCEECNTRVKLEKYEFMQGRN